MAEDPKSKETEKDESKKDASEKAEPEKAESKKDASAKAESKKDASAKDEPKKDEASEAKSAPDAEEAEEKKSAAPARHEDEGDDGEEEEEEDEDEEDDEDDEDEEDEDEEDAPPARPKKKRPALLLAQYDSSAKILHAAEKVRDAGYTKWDSHSPFPVHGMDAAMGLKDSKLGFFVFAAGFCGVTGAYLMMWWMGGVDYRIPIGDKPGFSLPSSVPIMFELMVLASAWGAILTMLGMNKLPRHNHPLFESERFRSATDDQFFISIEVEDPKFDMDKTRALLEKTHALAVELVEDEVEVEEAEAKEAHS